MPALFSPFLGWVAQILLFLCHCVHGVLPILVGSMENHCWDVPRNFNYLGGIHFWAELWQMNRSFFIFPERLLSLQKLSQKFFFAKVSRWRRQKFKSELDLKSFSSWRKTFFDKLLVLRPAEIKIKLVWKNIILLKLFTATKKTAYWPKDYSFNCMCISRTQWVVTNELVELTGTDHWRSLPLVL